MKDGKTKNIKNKKEMKIKDLIFILDLFVMDVIKDLFKGSDINAVFVETLIFVETVSRVNIISTLSLKLRLKSMPNKVE